MKNNTVTEVRWILIPERDKLYREIVHCELRNKNSEHQFDVTTSQSNMQRIFFQPVMNWFIFYNTGLKKFLKIEIFIFQI